MFVMTLIRSRSDTTLNPTRDFSQALEEFFGQGACFLLAKGRVALYAGLQAMNLGRGAKVVLPGYTCMVVPAAVQYAGLRPVYIDIDPWTYNLDPDLLEGFPDSGAAAVIVQHTYGIPAEMAAIRPLARSRGMALIEDCCHLFGTRIEGQRAGTFGAFAFMSGQWNKPFSTGLGGMLLVNDPSLAERVNALVAQEAFRPGAFKNLLLRVQMIAFDWLVNPSSSGIVRELYRALGRLGLVVGSSSVGELRGEKPGGYFSTMAVSQVRRGLRELARIEENLSHRARLIAFYHHELPRIGFAPLPAANLDLPLLRYPVRVANKQEVLQRGRTSNVEIGSWFESPLHPGSTVMEDFGYRAGMCPQAELASAQVINLPTHLKVDESLAEKILDFVGRCARPAECLVASR